MRNGILDRRLVEFEALFIPEPNTGCWLWIGPTYCRDYGCFEQQLAHRAAFELYIGPIPEGRHILHHCDVPPCVNPSHLYAGTHQQNMADMSARNRRCPLRGDAHPFRRFPELIRRGEEHGRARLTEADVLLIRSDSRPGTALAAEYGVSNATIYAIRNGRIWKHVEAT